MKLATFSVLSAFFIQQSNVTMDRKSLCVLDKQFMQNDENKDRIKRQVRYDKELKYGIAFMTDMKVNTDGSKFSYFAYPSAPSNTPRFNTVVNGVQLRDPFTNKVKYTPFGGKSSEGFIIDAIRVQHSKQWRRGKGDLIIDWVGIETYELNGVTMPCVAGKYYVSKTSVRANLKKDSCVQDKWLDSEVVPSVVIPRESDFVRLGAAPGDLVLVYRPASRNKKEVLVFGIVGDLGPKEELGEASIAMISAVSANSPPPPSPEGKKGWKFGYQDRVLTVVFPKSSRGYGAAYGDVEENSTSAKREFVQRWGDGNMDIALSAVRRCVKEF